MACFTDTNMTADILSNPKMKDVTWFHPSGIAWIDWLTLTISLHILNDVTQKEKSAKMKIFFLYFYW